jgi:hypothetical protein
MPWSSITGSYGSSTSSFLRNLYIAFHSCSTNLHFHQQCIRVPISPHLCQHLLLLITLDCGHSNWGEMKSKCCFDLHFFYNSSFENSLFNSRAYFFIGCWFFGGWVFLVFHRFWILFPYQMSSWQIFSPILWAVSWVWWLFHLLCRSSLYVHCFS